MKTAKPLSLASNQRGFTLIEALIAAIVLSIGLLGLAGLQAVSLKLSDSAYQRSQAAILAYEIADAIRANAGNATDYAGSHEASCNTDLSRASSGNVAADDIAEWTNRLACALPAGRGEIDYSNNAVTIKVEWLDQRARGTDTNPETGSPEDKRDQIEIIVYL